MKKVNRITGKVWTSGIESYSTGKKPADSVKEQEGEMK